MSAIRDGRFLSLFSHRLLNIIDHKMRAQKLLSRPNNDTSPSDFHYQTQISDLRDHGRKINGQFKTRRDQEIASTNRTDTNPVILDLCPNITTHCLVDMLRTTAGIPAQSLPTEKSHRYGRRRRGQRTTNQNTNNTNTNTKYNDVDLWVARGRISL